MLTQGFAILQPNIVVKLLSGFVEQNKNKKQIPNTSTFLRIFPQTDNDSDQLYVPVIYLYKVNLSSHG